MEALSAEKKQSTALPFDQARLSPKTCWNATRPNNNRPHEGFDGSMSHKHSPV